VTGLNATSTGVACLLLQLLVSLCFQLLLSLLLLCVAAVQAVLVVEG
jgi:hypothetical protein